MNRRIIVAAGFAVFLILTLTAVSVVNGDCGTGKGDPTLKAKKSWSPPGGFFFSSVTYQVNGKINPSSGAPGETSTWEIRVSGGELILEGSVELGSVSADFGPKSFSLPVGSSTEFPIPNTFGLIIVTAESEVDVRNIGVTSGPATTSISELHFSSEGSKQFDVKISNDASVGDKVRVSGVKVIPTLELGLKEKVPLVGPGVIAKREIYLPAFEPTLDGSTTVKSPGGRGLPFRLPGGNLMAIAVLLLIGVVGLFYFRRWQEANTSAQSKKGVLGVFGGILCLVPFTFTWITYKGRPLTGLEVGSLFAQLAGRALPQVVIYLLIFLAVIMIFGGYLLSAGFEAGSDFIYISSVFFLIISILLIIVLGLIPEVTSISFAPFLSIFGAIVGSLVGIGEEE